MSYDVTSPSYWLPPSKCHISQLKCHWILPVGWSPSFCSQYTPATNYSTHKHNSFQEQTWTNFGKFCPNLFRWRKCAFWFTQSRWHQILTLGQGLASFRENLCTQLISDPLLLLLKAKLFIPWECFGKQLANESQWRESPLWSSHKL